MVVAVEPRVKSSGALAVAVPGTRVCPLVEERAVVALHLAIRLRPVGTRERMGDGPERVTELAAAIAGAVIAEHSFNGDAEPFEKCLCSSPERGRSDPLFVVEDFAVGHAAVRVNGRVHERVTDRDALVCPIGIVRATMASPAATPRDPAQLPGVDMDAFAWPGHFIAPNGLTRHP